MGDNSRAVRGELPQYLVKLVSTVAHLLKCLGCACFGAEDQGTSCTSCTTACPQPAKLVVRQESLILLRLAMGGPNKSKTPSLNKRVTTVGQYEASYHNTLSHSQAQWSIGSKVW